VKRLLIANRGEIAVRIARACGVMGIESVAVFSEADAGARHVRAADMAVCIGPAAAAESYLNAAAILAAAHKTGADAIHPGYGFLSESDEFADAVGDAGLIWVGPPAAVIAPMHSKTDAKALAAAAGVPTAPAVPLSDLSDDGLANALATIGLPALVKPEHGGGGKGMQRIERAEQLGPAVAAAQRIAAAAFASDRLFLERLVLQARHVEVQVLADTHGNVMHVSERECSLQRRHQKVVEESPCSALSDAERAAVCASGKAFAAGIGYVGAGTVEFLFDPIRREHYFLEMNTRLQVEHPVTEMVNGVDLVMAQLAIARGARLDEIVGLSPQPTPRGHAVEARIYAEDPASGYLPQVGTLERLRWPGGPFVRVDSGFEQGDTVGVHYDPMLAKIIAWGADRDQAFDRLRAALRDTVIHGVVTNIPMLLHILDRPEVRAGQLHTSSLAEFWGDSGPGAGEGLQDVTRVALAAVGHGGPLERTNRAAGGAQTATEHGLVDPWQHLGPMRVGGEVAGEGS